MIEHRDVKVAQRRAFGTGDVAAGLEPPASATRKDDGQVGGIVSVAVGHAGAEQHHAVVQQRAFAFLDRGQLVLRRAESA